MSKNIIKLVVVFIFGMAGGVFADQILWPYLVEKPLYEKYELESSGSIIETKEVTIEENTALQDAVEKIDKSVVGVKTKTEKGIITGSGLVVTSDGLVITLNELIPRGGDFAFIVDGQAPDWQILKRDVKNNLALIKLERDDLKTVGFADFDGIRLGERAFLLGMIFDDRETMKLVNEGIVKFFTPDYIRTSISEKSSLSGSALFNIKGELLGLNTIDSEGRVTAIPITKIRDFIGY